MATPLRRPTHEPLPTPTQSTPSAASHPPSNWLTKVARAGYATKGVLYLIIGVLAIALAYGAGGEALGPRGAIGVIGQQPAGNLLLFLTGLGLLLFAFWRFLQAGTDPEGQASEKDGAKEGIVRFAWVVSGLIYGSLSIVAFRAMGAGQAQQGGGGDWTASLMAIEWGRWLVGAVGLIVVGVAIYQFKRAYEASFMKYMQAMKPKVETWVRRISRFGIAARGVTLMIVGFFILQAAWQADPREAEGLSGALTSLAGSGYGPWVLGLVALGLIAYSIFCFARARYSAFANAARFSR